MVAPPRLLFPKNLAGNLFWEPCPFLGSGPQELAHTSLPHTTREAVKRLLLLLVEETGFEPTTSWSRTKRATKLRYSSMIFVMCPLLDSFSKRHELLRCSVSLSKVSMASGFSCSNAFIISNLFFFCKHFYTQFLKTVRDSSCKQNNARRPQTIGGRRTRCAHSADLVTFKE